MLISNHTFWDKAPPYFQDLCREWSGKQDPFENHINTLKSISFSRKIALHVNLLHTDGTLLLRDELVKTFYRLRDAHAEKITKISGIVLDGNPGIGKSAANLLFLIGCLAYQQPVFFTPRSGAIYYFSGLSVWKFKGPGSMINLEHILELEFPGDVRPWSLIDINTSPPDALVCSELFPIQTVSLNPEHYQTWKKANTARMWIMQVWKEEDLEDLYAMLSTDRSTFQVMVG
ncbi:hypothetical protein GYMLUDRAFT_820125 [Collybiopsis luxurians FD-317 M1]|uniref:Uncharacterized protein n=1 Tax=Collybiopsis luxurians FD-317 M1 TaxID=944289 RepID=A0A0D0B076_9AGAR|nr:hypothetical protein GYMLUDRAFT_820125 [Collybiopsis luxurians FD-317 M1]